MAKIIIDGKEIEVPDHYTLLQACEEGGAEVPRFCFHERLSVAGNCRMCLVEVGGAPKPMASCAVGVRDLRPGPNGEPPIVNTKTPMVKKAREGVMEFLLINHPLDCPICDQGGECDLQDQAMAYGVDNSRYHENKRAVEDKYIGPLVKTIMTRCIHCTRCVRFTTEVAGISELGLIGRGEDAEITTYLEAAMTSELQGNVIDLCPVGALTSKPYAFKARPWELTKTETIDVMDAVGSNIRVDSRGREVMRILPRLNEAINEEWISDKTRFVWDGLKTQRLDKPYLRINGRLKPVSWAQVFGAIAEKVKTTTGEKIGAIAGDLCSVEEMFALKQLLERLGSPHFDCRPETALPQPQSRAEYLFNSTIEGIEQADALLIIGANPRLEASVLNARIRKSWRASNLPIALIGEAVDLTYDYLHLGKTAQSLAELVSGKGEFFKVLEAAQYPMIILGEAALYGEDGAAILELALALAQKTNALSIAWNGYNVLHNAASRVGALDIGFTPKENGFNTKAILENQLDVVFLLGADELDMQRLKAGFVVYIGTHGDAGAHRADVILPAAAYTEKSGLYVNMEGRVQRANRATFPPGEAREDWAIIRALSAVLGKTLPYDNLNALRAHLFEQFPHLAKIDVTHKADIKTVIERAAQNNIALKNVILESLVRRYYHTNPIARASKIMAECATISGQKLKEAAE